MQRGSSVHFKTVKSAIHAVSHADRTVSPTYLLPPDKSFGTVVVLDDEGSVASTLQKKLALASRQALRSNDYSPLWEGVINLRRPVDGESQEVYKNECKTVIQEWCSKYEDMTGHKVLRADVHLDEGHMDGGVALLNAHAHVIADKTNDKGRVIKLTPQKLRDIQTLTAAVTRLERGVNSRISGVNHLGHQAYRHMAEKGKLETQQQVTQAVNKAKGENFQRNEVHIAEVKAKAKGQHEAEIAELKAKYKAEREAMKASGQATQQAYQALKVTHESALAELVATRQELKDTNQKVIQMDKYTKKLEADLVESNSKIAQALVDKALAIEALIASGKKSEALRVTATGHRVAAEKLVAAQRPINPAPKTGEAPLPKPTKTASGPILTPSLSKPLPEPEKTLKERLKASWDTFVDWIQGAGGKLDPVTASSRHDGPVVQLDDLHCIQKTGRTAYAVHQLGQLDQVPDLQNPKVSIQYRDGVGQVTGGTGRVPKMR